MDVLIVFLFSYLSGSIPFGLILTKFFGGQDVRKIGSGNIGATNVLRTGNKYLAATTLILDILKGNIYARNSDTNDLLYKSKIGLFKFSK